MTLRAQTGAGLVASNVTIASGSQDGVTYTLGTFAYGGNTHQSQLVGQTTTAVSTVATAICTVAGDGGLLTIAGSDGTNKFSDTIMANLTSVNVIGSGAAAGSPTVRTYSSGGAGVIRLAMASGTYNINAFGFVAGQR